MSPFMIKCFKHGSMRPENAFFILSKGRNTGRPSYDPCPNCFVFTCDAAADLDSYYWLVYALWTGGRFHPLLCGSVIEFIHLADLKHLISKGAAAAKDPGKVTRSMQQIIQLESGLRQQMALVHQAKKTIAGKFLC
jgi:hypothetical protein